MRANRQPEIGRHNPASGVHIEPGKPNIVLLTVSTEDRLPWLANEGAARTGGLKAGQWVTTGSWTGLELGIAKSRVDVKFSTAGRVHLRFE